jgi:hypothetical protein
LRVFRAALLSVHHQYRGRYVRFDLSELLNDIFDLDLLKKLWKRVKNDLKIKHSYRGDAVEDF